MDKQARNQVAESYEKGVLIGDSYFHIQKENEKFKKSLDDRFMELKCAYEFISMNKYDVLEAGDGAIFNTLLDYEECTQSNVNNFWKLLGWMENKKKKKTYLDKLDELRISGKLAEVYDDTYNKLRNFYFRAQSFRPDLCDVIESNQ